ncbi:MULTISPECIES: hypothetical protein [Corynebacterium]|uniref:hypothetical protein n=1 Tax=Corynebacterium TaxID=1716 RepID=UPI000AD0024D|nr:MULTISPECIES: hypothetical protein [Corynebacterium]MDK8241100.1 hypothetical protein [Corynebacterium coyleae]MDK8822626.1 hypothetical protein [Corynebacterium coyleae]UBI08349.1 hypothetical protein LA324_08340 [Corynebacterium coyleae]
MKLNAKNALSMFRTSPTVDADAYASADSLAAEIRDLFPEKLHAINAMIHHPRSLSRPAATWRPPVISLPRIDNGPTLSLAVTRRRVGPRARARIQGYGQRHIPAYLIELRVTDAAGVPVDTLLAESWVRAVIPDDAAHTVHEIPGAKAASYVWLVDGAFTPIESPSSMFEGLSAA